MSNKLFNLNECKTQAAILLKQIRTTAKIDAKTFSSLAKLPFFIEADAAKIVKNIKLKHALYLIANKYGFKSWNNLKAYFEITSQTTFVFHSGFLNQWFASYTDAKSYLNANPQEFLLVYKNQFVVCDASCIEHMGFNPEDDNWQLIQHNWVEPEDYAAWMRLNLTYSKKVKGE